MTTPNQRKKPQIQPQKRNQGHPELTTARNFGLELGRLSVSCLMLLGSESPDWASSSTDAYAAALDNVRVHLLDGHGHGGAVTAPKLVARELIAFLRG